MVATMPRLLPISAIALRGQRSYSGCGCSSLKVRQNGTSIALSLIAPHPLTPTDPSQAIRDRLLAPSLTHWFGTDQLGRDLYTGIVYGTRTAIMIGFRVVLVSAAFATVLGVVSGYFGGWFDTPFQRLIDIGIAPPGLVFVILFITSLQDMPDGVMMPIILSLGILIAFSQSRVIRGGAISVKVEQNVDAARALGAGHLRIMWWHILPNVFAIVLVSASLQVGRGDSDRGGAVVPRVRRAGADAQLGTHAQRRSAADGASAVHCGLAGVWGRRSSSPSSASTCWATPSATCSTRGPRGS